MAEAAKTGGLLDLEKELTCSICTEVLFQPLTLLDCLHTFCGSCLKEWFSFEASQAKASKPNPFTCPSCRASVRETRPDAKVTTLLEMFLQANPNRGRTEGEKAELRKSYTPGENVIPKVRVRKETREEAADRRMVEEARDLSLRDVGIRGLASGSYERGTRHRSRDSSDSTRATLGVQDTAERNRRREHNGAAPDAARAQARQIEHQSSLRSLLSSSDVDSTEMEEEILRQIMEDGILDGIDLSNIDGTQEDELSEKIAEAYRRRHGRQRSRDVRNERSRRTSEQGQTSPQERLYRTREGRSSQAPDSSATHSSHPPLSRPHLLEAYPTMPFDTRRRTASETRRQTSPDPRGNSRVLLDTQRPAARSATDISSRAQRASDETRPRPSEFSSHGRRTTDPDRLQPRRASHGTESQRPVVPRSPNGRAKDNSGTSSTSRSMTAGNVAVSTSTSPRILPRLEERPTNNSSLQNLDAHDGSMPSPRAAAAPLVPSTRSAAAPPAPIEEPRQLYPEPSISCNRCGKANIEYEVHENCSICNDGNYDLCLRCYRIGRGCLHWFGFGHAALQRFERATPTGGHPDSHPPHRLKGHRYIRPPLESRPAPHNNVSYSDPATRLQSGLFCSNCSNYSPNCFWKCGICNEGEWGFCNSCVNQGDCCTHPLLPVALTSYLASHNDNPNLPGTPSQRSTSTTFTPVPFASPPLTAPSQQSRPAFFLQDHEHTPLTSSTKCDICTYPIPPSTTRFHCPHCNAGDYDVCTSCYLRLVQRGTITAESGPNGWRRCLEGHRMVVVGFEDSAVGQRRIIDKDLVGGRVLKDDEATPQKPESEGWMWTEQGHGRGAKAARANAPASASSTSLVTPLNNSVGETSSSSPPPLLKTFPPNGGVGMHVQALWSYWPADGVQDELAFPRGAEIRECEDINGDWFWGVYCGRKGLFPGNYGRVLGKI